MNVCDILRVKGNTLFTIQVDEPMLRAVETMAEHNIGSLVVLEHGDVVGILTFREVILAIVKHQKDLENISVGAHMDEAPLSCTMQTSLSEVSRMMLDHRARYMPVIDERVLMGVISFYDVAKAVVDSQNFENNLLKAYIREWPEQPQ